MKSLEIVMFGFARIVRIGVIALKFQTAVITATRIPH